MDHRKQRLDDRPLYSINAVCRAVKKDRGSIELALQMGQIAFVEIGLRKLIPRSELLRLLGERGE
jgi:hypothetical protein